MSILIQAGHRSSYADVIMQKLYERGLDQPFNSFTYNMSSQQVADKLHKIISREGVPLANNKLADNIMVDLLLSNLDTQNWGWSAEKNLFAMDLWQQLESEVKLILVFDHPSYLLDQLIGTDMTVDIIDQAMSEWVDYHQKMLEILEDHDDKAILIEGSYAVNNINNLEEQVKSIAHSLQLKSHLQISHDALDPATRSSADAVSKSNAAINYINREILKQYPEAIKLFNTLLNKSTVGKSETICDGENKKLDDLVSLLNFMKQAMYYKVTIAGLEREVSSLAVSKNKVVLSKDIKIKQLKNKINSIEEDLNKKNTRQKIQSNESINNENRLLVAQLNQVQRELELLYIKNKDLRPVYLKNSDTATYNSKYFGAVDRIKEDLPYRLGSTLINNSKTVNGIIKLPTSLFKEYSEFKSNDLHNLPKIEEYEDSYEAEKIKRHLSYKIGKLIVESKSSPTKTVKLPVYIIKEVLLFKKNH